MGLLSNRIVRDSLKAGDHIYSWRTAYIYAHHGIYIGENKVIHFTRHGEEVGTGTALDVLLVSSTPTRTREPCPTCKHPEDGHGVASSCLNCFLSGGVLYRFEYNVKPTLFVAKLRGGTCTLASSDPPEIVIHRAKFLLERGFGCYNVVKNNCEDFTIYCKTGLVLVGPTSRQSKGLIGGPLGAALSAPLSLLTGNVFGMAATAICVYCASRVAADIGVRKDVMKLEVEDLVRRLSLGPIDMFT